LNAQWSPKPVGATLALCVSSLTGLVATCEPDPHSQLGIEPVLTPQRSGVSVRLQAVSAVDENVVWVSGMAGTYARTKDGGKTWSAAVVPGTESLQFRDVDAFDENTAYLLSAGNGDRSRIYKTTDGGATWALQFTNDEPNGFFDCMAFWDSNTGIAFGDAVDSEFIVIKTSNGTSWHRVPTDQVPDALPGEGGFAASGTCLITYGDSTAWFGTGGGDTARVLKTTDRGATWSATATPIMSDSMSGITSIAFLNDIRGLAVGGSVVQRHAQHDNVAQSGDGGTTWTRAGRPTHRGAIYGISAVPGSSVPVFVAVGPGGADYTLDMGMTWVPLDTLNYWSVSFASRLAGWAVGPAGRVAKITF